MMLSSTLPFSPISAQSCFTMQSLTVSNRLVVPSSGSRLSPARLAGVSVRGGGRLLPCATLRSSSIAASSIGEEFDGRREFVEASKSGNLIPIYQCIFADQLTPVLAYRILVDKDDREAPSFLFESAEPNSESSNVGRYSVVGARPSMEIVAKENKVTVMDHVSGHLTEEIVDDPMVIPRKISQEWRPVLNDQLPDAFCGGLAGYFSYDTIRYVEKKKLPFSDAPKDDRNLADIHLGLYETVIVFDHVEKKAYVILWVRTDRYSSAESAYEDGTKQLNKLVAKLQDDKHTRLAPGAVGLKTRQFGPPLKESTMTPDAYKEAVLQAKEHIKAGDIFQARGCILAASSPEILARIKNKIVNRPLAGTCKRGNTPQEDEELSAKLLKDKKQCAEHVMLVDLGRNDVGKVAKSGSVKVEKLMNVERYSHVMHISSTVTGELQDNLTCWDALRAALPVGTVSGAPKVRAMQLIDELEVARRGPYSGGFGYISFSGDMDIALALRTIIFPTGTRYDTMYSYKDLNKRQEWIAYLQAGAGIVADSDPNDEHQECQNKAAGLARSIDLAEAAFVDK
ncbi:ASTRA complex subunit, variant 2 [Lathyrus oleraceus]|uniref:ASTRA complex subunit, variant 2 n=1 Tax=Pisum sativum TaxID=3888 RepID=A0A9D4WTR8_PEA|nr:ASTRA complex subunit, variant 2 [Pisum sativum]